MNRLQCLPAVGRAAYRTLWLAAAASVWWWILTGGAGWDFGGAVIVLATLTALFLAPSRPLRWSPPALARFVLYFLKESLLGGLDVARRALHPALPLEPALLRYRLRLPAGASRPLFLMTVSLLPGTLSADLEEDTVIVHALVAGSATMDELARLEARIAALFREPLGTRAPGGARHE